MVLKKRPQLYHEFKGIEFTSAVIGREAQETYETFRSYLPYGREQLDGVVKVHIPAVGHFQRSKGFAGIMMRVKTVKHF